MQNEISPDPKSRNEEYIKVEMIIRKQGVTQEGAISFIKRCNIFGIDDNYIEVETIAITGIEPVDKGAALNDIMNAAVTGAKSEITQEMLDEGQDIMAQKFFDAHPMWFVITNCPKCGTPNIDFPCKRCGYDS